MTTKKTFSKRVISLLLTLLMVISLVPLSAISTSASTASFSGFTVNIPHITRTIYYGNTTDVYNMSLFDPDRLSLGISNDTLYASITYDDRYSMNPDHKYHATSTYSVTPFPCTSQWSDNGYAAVIGKQAGESRMDISGGHWNWGRDEYTWRAEFTYTPFSSHNYATSDDAMYYTVNKAATCTSTGTATARCTNGVCNSYKTITLPIDPNNHNWGGWTQYGDSQHIRRCRNSGCTATQTANCAGKSNESLACGEINACTTCGRVLSDTPAQHTAYIWSATSDSFVATCFRCSTEIKAQLVSDETSYVYTGSPIKPLKLECTELYSFPDFEIVYDQNTTDVRDGVKGSVTYKNALVGLEFVNNQIVSKTQDLTISKTFNIVPADAKFTAPSAKEVKYNGQNQQLVTAGSTENGTFLYSLDKESWSEDIPTAKEEGTYKVYYKVAGDANHNDTEVFSVEATISPCSHQGGTATCKNKAVCEICSAEYGNIDKNNHAGERIPEFTFDTPYETEDSKECYVELNLICEDCGECVESTSGYAKLTESAEGTDCLNLGYELYEVTFDIDGVEYKGTNKVTVKSDNHVGEFVNGFCTECGGYEPAEYNEETGVYEISNAGQLYWYAQKLNEENAEIYAELLNDIVIPEDAPNWTPINCSSAYFDGNFKTISGLKCVGGESDSYVGLFGMEGWWYEISNLHIKDSYFEGKDYVGAVVACMTNGGYVKNCYVTNTTVKGSDSSDVGTLVGSLGISNVINCYVDTDNLVGYYNDSYGTVENSYYLADTDDGNGGKTAEQFGSGEVAYLLQSGVEGEDIYDDEWNVIDTIIPEIWGQKIGTDVYPVFGGDKVYGVTDSDGNITGYINTVQTDNLEGYTIGLGDKIAVNYYMSLTDETLNDENAKMVFTVPDTGSTYTVEIPVSSVTPDADGYYVFTCEVAAKEMTSLISAKLVTSESELVLEDYSVQKYAEVILADTVKYAKEQELVKKMLNYGTQAQFYFDYKTDALANDTEYMTNEEKVTELYDFAGAPFTLEGEETGVTYYGTALSLKTELAFKHYFVIDESVDVQSLEITCDYPVTLKKNGNLYMLIISGISAHNMGTNSLKVNIGGITLDYTIYSYGALAQSAGKEKLWSVVSALEHFASAASQYTNK